MTVPPWRPMSDAPKDGSMIVVMYEDLSGTMVCFWGEYESEPDTEGWFMFTEDAGDYEHTDEALTEKAYGWVPFPKGS